MSSIFVRPVNADDHLWVRQILVQHWGSSQIVSRRERHQADQLPGFVATVEEEQVGLLTYRLENDECEIVSLNSLVIGAGEPLVGAVKQVSTEGGCRRLWLITSNDNLGALRFYQLVGFALKAVYPNAIAEMRKLKPKIPLTGIGGLPLRDEIELEMLL